MQDLTSEDQQERMRRLQESLNGALTALDGGTMASMFTPASSFNPGLLRMSLGLGTNPTSRRSSLGMGMSSSELLIAAAQEQRILEEQNALVARQAELAARSMESRRKYQESLLALMKNGGALGGVPGMGNQSLGMIAAAASKSSQQQGFASLQQPEPEKAIKVIGNSLKKKEAPYLDVSALKDPDTSDRRTRGGVTEPFPEKLHRMLTEVAAEGKEDIISFFPHGRAFAVHKPEKFTSEIMPKYFKQSRLSSFQRQLNLYGFTRINGGTDAGGYYHELFLKGRPSLCVHMRRVGLPQGEDRRKMRAKNMKNEPDFYKMGVPTATEDPRKPGAV